MPTYQYRCTECDHAFEEFQSFTDDALTVCPCCGGRLRKVFNAVGVVFKGSGFYRTDSRAAGASSTAASASSANGSGDSGSSDAGTKTSGSKGSAESSSGSSGSKDAGSSGSEGLRLVGLRVVLTVVQHRRVVVRRLSPVERPGERAAAHLPSGHDPGPRPASFPAGRRARVRRTLRRTVLARRRPLAAACRGVAVLAGVHAARPAPRRDGAGPRGGPRPRLGHRPVSATTWSPAATPRTSPRPGSRAGAVGRTLAAPVRAGEPVTDVRLVAPSLVAGYPGRVALPVRMADADAVALLRVGDRVSLVAADPRRGTASYVAVDVPVLALPAADSRARRPPRLPGRLVVVAAAALRRRPHRGRRGDRPPQRRDFRLA